MGCTELKRIYNKDYNPKLAYMGAKYEIQYYDLPCGKCIGCLSDRSNRIAQLMNYNYYEKYNRDAIFVTLTYSNAYIPLLYEEHNEYEIEDATEYIIDNKKYNMYDENGKKLKLNYDGIPITTTRIKDIQDFMKRLRINLKRKGLYPKNGLCFVACTEYGDKGDRPHAHLVILGLFKCKEIEDIIEKSWTIKGELIGVYDVSECNGPRAISYVTKYITKNLEWNEDDQREKPKVWTSIGIEKTMVDVVGLKKLKEDNFEIQYGKKDFNKVSIGRYLLNKYNFKKRKDWDKLEEYIKGQGIQMNYRNEAERESQIKEHLQEMAELKERIKRKALENDGIRAKPKQRLIYDYEKIRKLAEESLENT